MPTNINDFNAKLTKRLKTLPLEAITVAQRKLSFQILEGIIDLSIYDTGYSRGNWQLSIGTPITENVGVRGPDAAISDGMSKLGVIPPFSIVWISNNVEYIRFLEFGTDKIPAVAMVQQTLDRMKHSI